jgi:hypothetical protein
VEWLTGSGIAVFVCGLLTGVVVTFLWQRRSTTRRSKVPIARAAKASAVPPVQYWPDVRVKEIDDERGTDPLIAYDETTGPRQRRLRIRGAPLVVALLLFVIVAGGILYWWLKHSRTTVQPTPPIKIEIVIKQELDRGISRDRFDLSLFSEKPVVRGFSGSTYRLEPKGDDKKTLMFFDSGKYTAERWDRQFAAGFSVVQQQVLQRLESNDIPYTVLMRGSADAKGNDLPFISKLVGSSALRLRYLENDSHDSDLYSPECLEKNVPEQYRNSDLPDLRAAYIQSRLSEDFKIPSIILKGAVTKRISEADRSALILLCVHWDGQKPQGCTAK